MRKSTAALSAALLLTSAAAIGFAIVWRAEHARNVELATQLATVNVTETSAAQAPPEPPTLVEAQTEQVPISVAPAVPAAAASQEDPIATERRLMRDPKYRAAWREQRRLNYAPLRENLLRVVGLTPAQADAVIELRIDRQESFWNFDVTDVTPENQARFEQREAENERKYQARLQQMMSADKIARLQAYMESSQSRNTVDRLRNQLAGAEMLRDDQVEALIAAIHAEQRQLTQELEQNIDKTGGQTEDTAAQQRFAELRNKLVKQTHDRIHVSAGAVLSHGQLQQLDAMLKRDRDRQETEDRMNRIQQGLERDSQTAITSN